MCYIYRQRGGENARPRCVDRGGNPPRVAAAPPVGLGKGRRTILYGLGYTYVVDSSTPCKGLNLTQHNTSNNWKLRRGEFLIKRSWFSILRGSIKINLARKIEVQLGWDVGYGRRLSPERKEGLIKQFSVEEVEKAIREMKTETIPGSNGFLVLFYKKF
jgi:hypothetical protein